MSLLTIFTVFSSISFAGEGRATFSNQACGTPWMYIDANSGLDRKARDFCGPNAHPVREGLFYRSTEFHAPSELCQTVSATYRCEAGGA